LSRAVYSLGESNSVKPDVDCVSLDFTKNAEIEEFVKLGWEAPFIGSEPAFDLAHGETKRNIVKCITENNRDLLRS